MYNIRLCVSFQCIEKERLELEFITEIFHGNQMVINSAQGVLAFNGLVILEHRTYL